jgi:phosphoketolase
MSASTEHQTATPDFCAGIDHFGTPWPNFETLGAEPVIPEGAEAIADSADPAAIYQTLLGADALRYLTLQVCGAKGSGHPGGFASSAEAHAALIMLGHTNIVTEVGHHAPGFYSSMFLDSSLEAMGIHTVAQMRERFREREGLLGHLSGAVPGILSPAGPLGQGQHFAMAGALLYPDKLFPVTMGDGGMGEPYPLSAMMHFLTAYPGDQLPPGAGVERLQPGAPRHGLHLGQRAHGRLLARPRLPRGHPGRCQALRRL